MTTAQADDRATSRSLGVAGLVLVGGWGVLTIVLVLLRIVLSRQPVPAAAPESSAFVAAALLSSFLWLGGYAALGVGLALAVAALAFAGRPRRALSLAALVGLCAAAGFVFESLRTTSVWDLHPDRLATAVATAGTLVAPLAAAVVAVLLGPVVRRPRSTPEPAAAG